MINQILKVGIFVTLGLWLKHRLRGLACLLFVLAISWILHSEYLSYVERSGDTTYLEWSFVFKWGVIFTGFGLYYLLVERRLDRYSERHNPSQNPSQVSEPVGDGFDFLRQKKTLDSEADIALKTPGRSRD